MAVTINGTTGVAVPLGTAGAPGVVNTTSATTGIYNPTSTTLGLSTNGTQAVYVDASQNVGIGTSSTGAGYRVSVAGSAASSVPLYLHSDATNGYVYSPNPLVVGSTGAYALSLVTNNTTQMTIASSGIITGTAGNLMLVQGTVVPTTSGTAVTVATGIPSWVRRITVTLSNGTSSSTSPWLFQLGTGATPTYVTSGYLGVGGIYNAAAAIAARTDGFGISNTNAATYITSGTGILTLQDAATNTWVWSYTGTWNTGISSGTYGSGYIALASALTAIRLTTVSTTDTFATGKVNIQYE